MAKSAIEQTLTGVKSARRRSVRAEVGAVHGLDLKHVINNPTVEDDVFSRIALGLAKRAAPREAKKELYEIRKRNPLVNPDKYNPIDVIQFCEDPDYLGIKLLSKKDYSDFAGPLCQKELLWKFCHEKDDRDGLRAWNELVLTLGMRGTKTTTVSMIELYDLYRTLMYENPQEIYGVLPKQEIFFVNVAGSQTQSKDTVFAKLEEFIPNSAWFQKYIQYLRECKTDSDGRPYYKSLDIAYEFRDKNLTVRALNSNSASQVGKTSKLIVFDELARMKTTDGDLAGSQVYSSLSKATQTFGRDGIKISSSSPWVEGDQMWQLNQLDGKLEHFLCYNLATWEFNPKITEESLVNERKKNPEDFDRDFGARWPKSEEDAVDQKELVDAVFKPYRKPLLAWRQVTTPVRDADGVTRNYVRIEIDVWPAKEKSVLRWLHGDPGKSDDSYAICVQHLELRRGPDGKMVPLVINDLTLEWMPDKKIGSIVDFSNVEQTIYKLWQTFNIFGVSFDAWQSESSIQWLRQMGVVASDLSFSQSQQLAMFVNLKALIYAGQFESYAGDEKTGEQFKALKRIGQKIDHPKSGKITDKDRSDCWMSCAFKLTEKLPITAPATGMVPRARIARGGGFDSPRRRL